MKQSEMGRMTMINSYIRTLTVMALTACVWSLTGCDSTTEAYAPTETAISSDSNSRVLTAPYEDTMDLEAIKAAEPYVIQEGDTIYNVLRSTVYGSTCIMDPTVTLYSMYGCTDDPELFYQLGSHHVNPWDGSIPSYDSDFLAPMIHILLTDSVVGDACTGEWDLKLKVDNAECNQYMGWAVTVANSFEPDYSIVY